MEKRLWTVFAPRRPGDSAARPSGSVCFAEMMTRRDMRVVIAVAGLAGVAAIAGGQTTYRLDPAGSGAGDLRPVASADTSPEAQMLDKARQLLADDRPGEVIDMITAWVESEDRRNNPYLPEAYLIRGRARLADGNEEDALRDYERIIKNYPASEQFVPALQRELEVARLYLAGMRRKALGLRIASGKPLAEEIIIRINERLPSSRLAEDALIELADFYYAERDLRMAAETYDVFLFRFPHSAYRARALQRRAFASIARFKGPEHDASGLIEARYQIEDFQREFPADAERLGMSDALIARLDDSAAQQLMSVANWYLARGEEAAARYTLTRLIRRHPGTASAREALAMFTEHAWPLPGLPEEQPLPLSPEAGKEVAPGDVNVPAARPPSDKAEPLGPDNQANEDPLRRERPARPDIQPTEKPSRNQPPLTPPPSPEPRPAQETPR